MLEGIHRISARDRILREVISNTLAHRDYSSAFPAKFIINEKCLTIENSNLANEMGVLSFTKFDPYPKNPAISKVFREIGLADELGSGLRNTNKYSRLYSGCSPIFEEGYIFKTIIPLKKIATRKVGIPQDIPQEIQDRILQIIENDNTVREYISQVLGVSVKTVSRYIRGIPNLKYMGCGIHGYWHIEGEMILYYLSVLKSF